MFPKIFNLAQKPRIHEVFLSLSLFHKHTYKFFFSIKQKRWSWFWKYFNPSSNILLELHFTYLNSCHHLCFFIHISSYLIVLMRFFYYPHCGYSHHLQSTIIHTWDQLYYYSSINWLNYTLWNKKKWLMNNIVK